jgi:glutaredoxin-related protein
MKKFFIIFLILTFSSNTYAKKNTNTWDFPFYYYQKFKIEGSKDAYKFKSNLRKDSDVLKEIKNNKKTGLISYLLFEDNKIVIDESDIPKTTQGETIVDELLPSHSMGKSLVSYVLGHAICEGYISDINEKLTGWKLVKNTLFEDQVLIDLLNMKAGDQRYVGEKIKPQKDNILKKDQSVNVNTIPLETLLKKYFQNTKKSKAVYNYSALTTNVIMNYTIFKTGEDWEKLLNKIFNEHVKVKDNVYFYQTLKIKDGSKSKVCKSEAKYSNVWYQNNCDAVFDGIETGRYSFLANRYDYLRIAKTMMEDWHNDTCAGKYLKTIYENRIKKKDNVKEPDDVGLYTKSYGGQFHFDIYGIKKTRKIIGLSGYAGQQILIDLDNKRIIVVSSLFKNYDWKNIVHKKIKNIN